jgi:hypothetical protein
MKNKNYLHHGMIEISFLYVHGGIELKMSV